MHQRRSRTASRTPLWRTLQQPKTILTFGSAHVLVSARLVQSVAQSFVLRLTYDETCRNYATWDVIDIWLKQRPRHVLDLPWFLQSVLMQSVLNATSWVLLGFRWALTRWRTRARIPALNYMGMSRICKRIPLAPLCWSPYIGIPIISKLKFLGIPIISMLEYIWDPYHFHVGIPIIPYHFHVGIRRDPYRVLCTYVH